MRIRSLVIVAIIFLGISALTTPLMSNEVSDGKILFHTYCSTCHGEEAVGQDTSSPSGGWLDDGSLIAPALNGSAHAWHHEPELLFSYVKDGSVSSDSPMPSFGEELTDVQIWSITRYYQSLWPEKIRNIYQKRFPGGLGP